MGLNQTPTGERVHIGFFGKRNVGKSRLVNAITGQNLAIVSDVKGTTTDPVYKTIELLPLGPAMIIDTPGIDDEGELGLQRIGKSRQVLNKTDIAVLVADAAYGLGLEEENMLALFDKKKIPYLIAYNKSDLKDRIPASDDPHEIWVSAASGYHILELKEQLAHLISPECDNRKLVGDLLKPSELVILVIPIDKAAPKGRLILPQQQVIRDILDAGAIAAVCKEDELSNTLTALGRKPKLVITDSQIFPFVDQKTPSDVMLTSFSILFARYKGNLERAVQGAKALDALVDGDKILISEGCTHHRQCGDIGTVKLPLWMMEYTGKKLNFHHTSGGEFPEELSHYQLVVHCGGCMLNEREMKYRSLTAADQKVPMTNYGIVIAYMKGILKRSLKIFGEL